MSVGTIATVGVPVVTAAAGYGGRVVQDWYTNHTERDNRQRAIAGQAQEDVDAALSWAVEWQRRVSKTGGAPHWKEEAWANFGNHAASLARHGSNLNDREVPKLVTRFVGEFAARAKDGGSLDDLYGMRDDLRDRLGRYFH